MKGALRVVGGIFRNRRLAVVPGSRPTSERAREALFDILGDRVRGWRVLELFAGSAAVAIEALSRGAAEAVAVDRDPRAAAANARAVGAPLEVVGEDSVCAARRLALAGRRFDLVFLDPPYGEPSPPASDVAAVAAPDGWIVWQTDAGAAAEAPEGWEAFRTARYGRNAFTFLRRR
ncbi:MAG TPA: RsmD family RNA methyltransferase [Thermoanaerobaculia bacterium]|nr:RsmD family RNA methyltransferase [Thermoanaerobaculia bacterium]